MSIQTSVASSLNGAVQLFAWSTLTLDDINGELQIGGPCSYGGAALESLHSRFGLRYRQAVNAGSHDELRLPRSLLPQVIVCRVPESVRFSISQRENHRLVRLDSEPFRVDERSIARVCGQLDAPVLVLSPVIGEFDDGLFQAAASASCNAVFVDPFNNDDGEFSSWDIKVLSLIVRDLAREKKVFLKLSEPEYCGVAGSLPAAEECDNFHLIVTRGAAGADLVWRNRVAHAAGIRVLAEAELGAGDVFLYTFAGLYALGWPLKSCLLEANRVAARSVTVAELDDLIDVLRA